ncbi:MAG: hypothetical protein WAL08_05280 [Candidatus Sulfotelmatobacter sp.]
MEATRHGRFDSILGSGRPSEEMRIPPGADLDVGRQTQATQTARRHKAVAI